MVFDMFLGMLCGFAHLVMQNGLIFQEARETVSFTMCFEFV